MFAQFVLAGEFLLDAVADVTQGLLVQLGQVLLAFLLVQLQPLHELGQREAEGERNVLFNDTLNTFYLRLFACSPPGTAAAAP